MRTDTMEIKLMEDWIDEKREEFQNQAEDADGEKARIYAKGFLSVIDDIENNEYEDMFNDMEAWLSSEYLAAKDNIGNAGMEITFYNSGRKAAIESVGREFSIDAIDKGD